MCGIAGIVVLRAGAEVPELALQSMTRALSHRGPDAEGLWQSQDRRVGFGHRRLAIVDLSPAGEQPMQVQNGAAVVTFNGEIYNFRELRCELEAKGYIFKSGSDTEVLLNLYLDRGTKMVRDLDGDFAFAIYDARERKVFIARDPAGLKPLYYAITQDYVIFASEVRAILTSGLVGREVDEEALYHYLTYLVTPPGMTMVRDIAKLETATAMLIDGDGIIKRQKYWDPLPSRTDASEDALDNELKSLFDESVKKRLMSDVPLGVLFSGGVDSTLNAGSFAKAISPNAVDSFTVGMPGTRQDESGAARSMAQHLGLRHHEVMVDDKKVLDHMLDIASAQDEPLSDPVCLPLYFVSKLARESGVTVLQAGEGADELFCGYSSYVRYMQAHKRYWKPLSYMPKPALRAGRLLTRGNAALAVADDALSRLSLDEEFFMSSAIGFYESEKSAVLSQDYRRRMNEMNSFDVVRPLYQKLAENKDATFLQKMTYIDLQVRLPELLLMRVDKMSMAHSLEVRAPFLDKKLIEFAMRAPDEWKLRNGIPKEPVKKLASAYAPREIIYKPKQGFGAPLQQWFGGAFRPLAEEMLSSPDAALYFDTQSLLSSLRAGLKTSRSAFQIWVVLNFLLWKKQVLDKV